ncbi:indole-3-glycerol phosphate synthase TrpC [Microbacterium sp. YY-01]|uniref:indole-3-glycerol phosphate synthase TrpC n=1 Tax=Microbacterium sp. YY-01 TaxID=3421634 RepID=UPI003D1716B1
MVLAALTAGAVEDAERRALTRPLAEVERDALARPAARDAVAALAPTDRVKIIAEVKRASPSRGVLAEIPDPALQAGLYQQGGASAISVLTEERRFGGSLADLEAVTAAVQLPVLRKDFIASAYQVFEARAAGADLALLIVAGLEDKLLRELYNLILELGMTPLVETHAEDELERAIDLGASLIGVNARNLHTLELDRDLFGRLVDRIPASAVKIAESAVLSPDDVRRYRSAGADVVLIGEALVTNDPVETLAAYLEAGA